jgi:2',3'-cyclic-nucleotide 2'-phosphodiesterase (5'-nucleotidase family)
MLYRQILIACVTLATLTACAPPGNSGESIVDLRILETSDIHMHVVDYDYLQDQPSVTVGLARTAALLAVARAEVANSVLVDNGDLLQGNPLGDFMARTTAWNFSDKVSQAPISRTSRPTCFMTTATMTRATMSPTFSNT